MLQHLLIKDLAIVAHVDISFSSGMTVITGETGAGKSILLDALSLTLGERSDSQLVRPGAEKAEITATFDITSLPGAILWLNDLELNTDSTGTCIIRRILYANGRSRAFINGSPVTTQQLRLLGEYLVQIHGQHQHQLLLKPQEQLRLLDAFGQHDQMVSQVKTAFTAWEKLQLRKANLIASSTLEQAKIDLLQYQIAELEALGIGEKELENLYQEHDKLAHAQSYIQNCEHALALLENQEDGNVIELLTKAQFTLRPLLQKLTALKNATDCLENAHIQLKEAILEINHFIEKLEINPIRLHEIENRLDKLHEMARKHKVEPGHLCQHYQQLLAQAQHLATLETTLVQLDQEIELAKEQYQYFADQLTPARQIAAKQLAKEVTQTVSQLAMPGAVFTVDLITHCDNQLHLGGNETVLFGISANPGHPPQPLHKVASGGELSRVSLALELILAKFLATPCLVFDEVDVGISGKVGALVGNALYHLGQSAQVLCITHLPQVAAFGDQHLQVTKHRLENSTQTQIQILTESQRIEEIAKMLGGIDVTTQARANAKQLLRRQVETTTAG